MKMCMAVVILIYVGQVINSYRISQDFNKKMQLYHVSQKPYKVLKVKHLILWSPMELLRQALPSPRSFYQDICSSKTSNL